MDDLDDFMQTRPPTASRPFLGLTVLVVEDSRFACDAVRLLCIRSGARIRRADSLEHARRHLAVYRPSVVIVDLGLPDGPGEMLIGELAGSAPRPEVILGMSGDDTAADRALSAGADGFLSKPFDNIAVFQSAILRHLPIERQPRGPRLIDSDLVQPDPIALRDDLAHASDVLRHATGGDSIDYVTQFLAGLALSARDPALHDAVTAVSARRRKGGSAEAELAFLATAVDARLERSPPI